MEKNKVSAQTKLMVIWIFVKLNVVSADLLSFLEKDFLKNLIEYGKAEQLLITPTLLLISALLLEINIIMIIISKLAPYKINRILNIIAPIIVIIFIIGGGSLSPHYIFFATVECIALISIIMIALKWKNE